MSTTRHEEYECMRCGERHGAAMSKWSGCAAIASRTRCISSLFILTSATLMPLSTV